MQSNRTRAALVVGTLVIAVAAFLVLRPSADDGDGGPTTAGQNEPAAEQAGGQSERGTDGAAADDQAGADGAAGAERGSGTDAPTTADVPEVRIEDGEPVGGVESIEVESGEPIEFVVTSDAPDELHVHGYEITKQVSPNQPARFSFPAELEGIFEVEAHDAGHALVAELRVTP